MFCKKCGAENAEGAVFCSSCGGSLGEVQATAKAKKRMNLAGIIASVVVAISAFLPFASASAFGMSISASLTDGGDGYIVLAVAVAALIFSIFGLNIGTIVAGVVELILFFVENSSFSDLEGLEQLVQKSSGYYFLLIGSIAMIAAGIVDMILKKNK